MSDHHYNKHSTIRLLPSPCVAPVNV